MPVTKPFLITNKIPSAIWLVFHLADFAALAFLLILAIVLRPEVLSTYPNLGLWAMGGTLTCAIAFCSLPALARNISEQQIEAPSTWTGKMLSNFRTGLLRVDSRAVLISLILGILIWSLNIGGGVLALKAFQVKLSFAECALVSILATALNLLPIRPPLGIGTSDVIWVGTLVLFGVSLESAVSLNIALRLYQIFILLIDGVVGTTILGQKRLKAAQAAV